MLFADVPPDTSAYMIAGYIIFFVVTAIYVASLYVRTSNLARDLEALKNVEEEQKAAAVAQAPKAPPAAPKPRAAKAKTSKAKTTRTKKATRKTR